MQEFEAARAAVLVACPAAWVVMDRTEWVRPIRVTVALTSIEPRAVLWEGCQRSLFAKNAAVRLSGMKEIEDATRRALV